MLEAFLLSWRSLMRTRALPALWAAVGAIHAFMPAMVRSDGTDAGRLEMFVRSVTGSAFAVTALATLVLACGSVSGEKACGRFALTAVRPASLFAVLVGRWLGFCAAAATAVALSAGLTALGAGDAPRCHRSFAPALPPAEIVAREIMEDYLRNPESIESGQLRAAVTNSPRSAVLALLKGRETDRFETCPPGGKLMWPVEGLPEGLERATVRARFATQLDQTAEFSGVFTLGALKGAATNKTQSVQDVRIFRTEGAAAGAEGMLVFENTGKRTVMLRPRRDVEALVEADSFGANLARASVQMFADVALLAAFGLFLSSALSRPVATFAAVTFLVSAMAAPSVAEAVPLELDASWADRVGAAVADAVARVAEAAGAAHPVRDLATGARIGEAGIARSLAANAFALPCALLALAAAAARKTPAESRA